MESSNSELSFLVRQMKINCSAAALFRCLAAKAPKGSTRAEVLCGCSNLDRSGRNAEVGFRPRTLRSIKIGMHKLVKEPPMRLSWMFVLDCSRDALITWNACYSYLLTTGCLCAVLTSKTTKGS
ncbi:hypothetical protein T265_11990 [Opisthorchis viverrini]|uniref:Uncharacterized protein n=1 Tax=Opisthorchis viverrini TaxID=6198 RepID=A0A074YWJ0_OPIVI|nr:hypothetical protein T265_11990 [Opisthorchis viverrini]KER19131.1 hypothetical protein T265_11990 [Opisthorchis viverrini]